MKKLAAIIALSLILIPLLVQAQTAEKAKDFSLFVAGLGTGLVNHELGHQVIASVYGVHLDWQMKDNQPTWFARSQDHEKLRNIALGGTAAEIVSSEIILNTKISKDDAFVIGWLAWNIVNPILYVVRHELGGGHGDLKTIQENSVGLNVRLVEGIKISHSLWTAYRLLNNKQFQSKINYFFAPTAGGFMASLSYHW